MESYVHKIPDNLTSEHAAPLQCAGSTVYSALIGSAKPGDRVGVIGIGGLVHPRVVMRANTNVTQAGDGEVITETRRIITIPPYLSAVAILAGGGLIFMSARKT